MTRKKQKLWTIKEEEFLKNNASSLSLDELSLHLGRSPESVKQKAKRLRLNGGSVSLKQKRAKLGICPWCGKPRSTIKADGICKPCRLAKAINQRDSEIYSLLQKVNPQTRAHSVKTEKAWQEKQQKEFFVPKYKGEQEGDYVLRLERTEIKTLERKLATRRRRIERLKNSLRDM